MNDNTIPDEDHISRYCKPSKISEDGQIEFGAFMLRKDEEGLSVDWLESLNCPSREEEIIKMREIYSTRLTVGVNAQIAILNVGEVRQKVLTESLDNRNLEVQHSPYPDDPSHSEIYNLRPDQEMIAELILEVVSESYPARTPK